MRRIRSLRRCLLASLLLIVPGCGQKLDYETSLQLGEGEVQALSIDAPTRAQKVSVRATSSGSPIDFYVVLEKDKEAGKQALLDRKKAPQAVVGIAKTQEATLEAMVPVKTGFVILLGGASKSSQVKVKVTGR